MAGKIIATVDVAKKLETPRNIGGVPFDGSADVVLKLFGFGLVNGDVLPLVRLDDLNNTAKWKSGVYMYADAGIPGTYGHVLRIGGGTFGTNGGWFTDVAFSTNRGIYTRQNVNDNVWTAWKTVVAAG